MSLPLWKKFEDDLQTYLDKRAEVEPMMVEREYDTRSAGDFLPARPGDFWILSRGRFILLEAKHSTVHRSLTSCFASSIRDDQLSQHRRTLRAGGFGFYIFKSEVAGSSTPLIQLWNSRDLIWIRDLIQREGRPKRLQQKFMVRSGTTIDEVLRNLWTTHQRQNIKLL
jgi:hypothetical protein